ncbi:MAG: type II toxin-antitoxin system Phd/YefM family antitoxin [Microcoleus sp.]
MIQGRKAADNNSIVPAKVGKLQDNFDNSVMLGDGAMDCEGFIRLTTEEFQVSAIEIIKRVMFEGSRFVLQQAGEDAVALIPEEEFHKLDYLMAEIKPSQFMPDEEEYYADEGPIHCMSIDKIVEDLDDIIADIQEFDDLFGVLPLAEMGENVDIFISVAILMSVNRFWVPEYAIEEKESLK